MEFGVHFLGMRFLTDSEELMLQALEGAYSPSLVAASIGFAILGSYAAFLVSQLITNAKRRLTRTAWLMLGAVSMGGGVWSMHFVGMLAYALPIEVDYGKTMTAASVIPSIAASVIVLFIISKQDVKRVSIALGGVLMGAGIGVMHFMGMSAMHGDLIMAHDPLMFAASIGIAIVLAYVALSVKFQLEKPGRLHLGKWVDGVSAAIMGLAISGMHYAAMAAVTFYPCDGCGYNHEADIGSGVVTYGVNLFVFLVIGCVLSLAAIRRNMADKKLLNAVITNSMDGLVVTDRQGEVTLFSPAAEKIFGYEASEIVGRNVSMLMPERMRSQHNQDMTNYDPLGGNRIMHIDRQLTGLRKDGKEFPVEIGVSKVEVGRDVIFSSRIRDVTEQKKSELSILWAKDELERGLARQRTLNEELERSNASMDLMSAVATTANQSMHVDEAFSFCLESICSFTGWEVGHVYKLDENGSGKLLPSGNWCCADKNLCSRFQEQTERTSFDPGEGLPGQVFEQADVHWIRDLRTADNFPRAQRAIASGLRGGVAFPVRVGEKVVAVFEFYSSQLMKPKPDLIEILTHVCAQMGRVIERADSEAVLRGHADELVRALSKERKLNELQRQFVSMASHEFRTPLAIIDSAAQRLSRHMDKMTPEEMLDGVEGIRSSVKRIINLMESTLSAEKMEAGKLQITAGECDLRTVILEVCIRQMELNQDDNITCDLKELPVTIRGDCGALDQVLTNLMSNAVKYSPGTADIHVRGWREGEDVLVSLRDRGLGIDEEDLPKMFSRFFRAKTSTGIEGTGIGLTLVKKLIEAHDGTVAVQSKKGEGSTFTVRLPIAGPAEAASRNKAA